MKMVWDRSTSMGNLGCENCAGPVNIDRYFGSIFGAENGVGPVDFDGHLGVENCVGPIDIDRQFWR